MFTIYHDLIINVPNNKVFEAFSTTHGLNNWWTLKCNGKFEIGEIINLNFTDDYNWYAKIEKLIPNKEIEFSMINATEEWMPTHFGFILHEENLTKTSLEFYHSHWKTITKEYRVTSYCWASLLSQMKQYLEEGIITPFKKRN